MNAAQIAKLAKKTAHRVQTQKNEKITVKVIARYHGETVIDLDRHIERGIVESIKRFGTTVYFDCSGYCSGNWTMFESYCTVCDKKNNNLITLHEMFEVEKKDHMLEPEHLQWIIAGKLLNTEDKY